MNVIVGLGNPGRTYHETRHNVGFMVIQLLAERHRVSLTNRLVNPADALPAAPPDAAQAGRPACVYGDYQEGARAVRLLMPLTMMNESGEALRAVRTLMKDLLIVCDDVNLPLGAIRLRPQGSAGGHHGLQSCLEALGTEECARLRIGVGIDPLPRDLHDFVLSSFSSAERPRMKRAIEQAADACEAWVKEGIEVAMSRYNTAQVGE